MKIAAILLANASAIFMGNSSAPHDGTPADVEEVQMGVHVVYQDGEEVDTWLMIDAIIDHDAGNDDESSLSGDESSDSEDESSESEDESDEEDAEPGFCRNVVHQQYHWIRSSTGEVVEDGHEECFDACLAAGGYQWEETHILDES